MQKERLVALIVDTDFTVASKLTNILYEMESVSLVLHASNYTEAVNVLRHHNVSVLLLEIILPRRNGIELLRAIHDAGYKTQVIMISHHSNSYYRELCNSLGASYFFDKSDDLGKIPFIVTQLHLNCATKVTEKSFLAF